MTGPAPASSDPAWTRLAPWILGLLAAALALVGSWRASPTDDEPTYVGQGNYMLSRGDFRAPVLLWQPPLALYVQAAGLACVDVDRAAYARPRDPESLTELGDSLIFGSPASPETVLRASRIPIALATGLLAVLAALLARRLAGDAAMIAAGALVAFSPLLYGHGGLATTDLVATLAALVAVAGAVGLVRAPPDRRGVRLELAAGAALGFALLAKHTALTLAPLAVGVAVYAARRRGLSWRAATGRAAIVLAAAAFVVWAGYGFDVGVLVGPQTVGDLSERMAARVPLPTSWVDAVARHVPVPAPRWFQSLVYQSSKQHGRLYFRYFSEIGKAGWWTYFPVVTLGKLTLGSVALCVLGAFTLRGRRPSADEWTLFLGFSLPFAAAVVSRHNLGARHVLPALPPLFVLAAVLVARATEGAPRRGLAVAAACFLLVHVGEGLTAYGDPIAWWNVAFGGTQSGWRVSGGANADWGQGLWELREFVRREGLDHVHLAAEAPQSAIDHLDEPRIEPLRGEWWRALPTDGWIAVSTSALWFENRVPVADAPPERFVAGCYRLYRLPLAPRAPR